MATAEASKEAVWLRKFLGDLEVIMGVDRPITLYYDNSTAIANIKESRHHKKTKHIDRKYHMIREYVDQKQIDVCKVASEDNIADPFTKTLVARSFERHVEAMGMRNMAHLLA